jgi:hypothetical protein
VEYVNKSHKYVLKFAKSLLFWNFLQKTIPPIYRNRGSITNGLLNALQSKDQNIVSAMNMIVSLICGARNIMVPNMDDNIAARGYPSNSRKMLTCLHHYKIQIFNDVLDRNIVEMNHRFSKTSTLLLLCTSCLDPRDSFNSFDNDMLVELATIYSADFSSHDCCILVDELNIYVDVMKRTPEFIACDSLSDLALKLVQKRFHWSTALLH